MKKIKRPLLAAAIIFAAASFIFTAFFPEAVMPAFAKNTASSVSDGDSITVCGRIYKTQKKTYSVYVYLNNAKAAGYGGRYYDAKKALIIIPTEDYEEYGLKIGYCIEAQCSFSEFDRARNNGNYDEEYYYRSLGIFLKAKASSVEITKKSVNWPAQLMSLLKDEISQSFDEILGDGDAAVKGVFAAIVTGDKSDLTEGTKSLYSNNGIAHILAVSGLHISVIGMGLFSLLKKFAGPYKSGLISSGVMVLYCIMCGLSVSSLRAVIMFIVRMAAYRFGKTYDLLSALGLAALVILVPDPFYILNSGFIFSFLAILSIGVVNKNLSRFLKPEKSAAKALLSGISVSAVSLPAAACIYYTVPVYGVLLNLVVIPLMSLALGSALAAGVLGIFSAAAGRFFAGLGYYTVYFINLCCYLAGLMWMSTVVTGAPGVFRVILFYLTAGSFTAVVRTANTREADGRGGTPHLIRRDILKNREAEDNKKIKKRAKIRRTGLCVCVLAVCVLLVCVNPSAKDLEIIMFDVDQGDGILIKTPEGVVILIDGGSTGVDELWNYRLESALEYEGVSAIDYCIVTHPDSDHISAVEDLINDETTPVKIEKLLIPYIEDNENYDELVSSAQNAGISVINIHTGMAVKTETVTLTCIHPDENGTFEDTNDYSAVLSLEYGSFSALFTGDIGEEVELSLIEEGRLLNNYDLLKVAHHGSKYSSCEEFLESVNPSAAIISAGVDNSYGHPASETLQRLESCGADIYVTSQTGEIKITVDKEGNVSIWTKL